MNEFEWGYIIGGIIGVFVATLINVIVRLI